MQKKVMAIHDISCVGRCSLTVALPILSSAGIETGVLPTAVLSTHTGGFEGFTFKDLTEELIPIANHWKSLGVKFDALYTGYLGSFEQLELVSHLFEEFGSEENILFVDPVMADNGKLYAAFSEDFPKGMANLCKKADVILPNITEATLLLGQEYKEGPYEKEYIETVLKELAELGPKKIILTGIYFDSQEIGAATYDRESGEIHYILYEKIPGHYHGTGDIFGSVLLAGLLNELPIHEAAKGAAKFTANAIRRTYHEKTDTRFGVNFEYGLGELANLIKE